MSQPAPRLPGMGQHPTKRFRWDEHSYERIATAGIRWQDAIHILFHADRRVWYPTGGVLRVAGETPSGEWIAITLIEEGNDEYLIVAGRVLDDSEVTQLRSLFSRHNPSS